MTNLTPNAIKFLAKSPTLIGCVGGARYYESPTYGDESPLIVVTADGRVKRSDFWDMPSLIEHLEDNA